MPYRAAKYRAVHSRALKFTPPNFALQILYRRILRLGILLGRICIAKFRRVEFCLKILRRKIPLLYPRPSL
ncbi:hypothetical protein [uncultured Campylobacter sp.]|uniref:hypothetical protein n=1 Tax=uncultured Campylobacter sp. TaxID=218934 RepID=UPI0028EF0331|nr:hypothetical protein [uncultured Campylobacter sp.]